MEKQISLRAISFETSGVVVHYAAIHKTDESAIREIVIYQFPGDETWTLSRADYDEAGVQNPQFADDEDHASLYSAYNSLIRSHLSVPHPL